MATLFQARQHGALRGVSGSHGSLEWCGARARPLEGRSSGSGNDARETHLQGKEDIAISATILRRCPLSTDSVTSSIVTTDSRECHMCHIVSLVMWTCAAAAAWLPSGSLVNSVKHISNNHAGCSAGSGHRGRRLSVLHPGRPSG